MCSLDTFKIDLKGLEDGHNSLTFNLHDDYFEAINAPEVSKGNVCVNVDVQRCNDVFTLDFHLEGIVIVPCDRCLDDMEQPIETDNRLTAKLGETFSDEDDEVVTVEKDEGTLDVSWLIYEFIVLSLPIKHVHAPGKCNAAMMEKLEELSAARSGDGEEEENIDPRWKKLLDLKNENTELKD